MSIGAESRDPRVDKYFDKIPEQYREVVRKHTLGMSIDIMLARSPLSKSEVHTLQSTYAANQLFPEVRRLRRVAEMGREATARYKIETWYVQCECIEEALAIVKSLFTDLDIPLFGKGELRYYTPEQAKIARGGKVISTKVREQGECYPDDNR